MVLTLWWVSALLILVGILAFALAYRNRRSVRSRPLIVANSEYLDQLPTVRRAQRVSRVTRLVGIALAGTLVLTSAVLSGRLADERVETPEFATRDIVLCLDVSGSMLTYDREIVETFAELVENFDGERVGLAIFNAKSRTVFPLTNDYGLIRTQLDEAADALNYNPTAHRLGTAQYSPEQVQKFEEFVGPTEDMSLPPSLIGDGVASCAHMFDQADAERSRFMIVATDNEAGGPGIYDLPTAADAASSRGISLWSFFPGAQACGAVCAEELEKVSDRTGGQMFASRDPAAIPAIITQIEKAQAVSMGVTPRIIRTDHPFVPFALTALLTVAAIVVGWRSR